MQPFFMPKIRAFYPEAGVSQPINHSASMQSDFDLASFVAYIVALGNFLVGLTINQWCMLIGTICAVGTFSVNWWYKRKEDQRAEKLVNLQYAQVMNALGRSEAQ